MRARPYEASDRARWDEYVRASRMPHFLFERAYMEYHADRFVDASLVVEDDRGRVAALLPASRHGEQVVSHGGLTYGGIVSDRKVGAERMLEVLAAVAAALAESGATSLRYKAVPHVYHVEPAEEDLFALYRAGAKLARRDMSAAIDLARRPRLGKGRRWSLGRADPSIEVRESADFDAFIELETTVLERHGVVPVHSGEELALLQSRFPDNLRLFAAERGGELLGGIVTFETPQVLHTQYIGASPAGKEAGAVDVLMAHLLERYERTHRWLEFGISSEDGGRYLNRGLAAHKESFGARGVVYDQYDLALPVPAGVLDPGARLERIP